MPTRKRTTVTTPPPGPVKVRSSTAVPCTSVPTTVQPGCSVVVVVVGGTVVVVVDAVVVVEPCAATGTIDREPGPVLHPATATLSTIRAPKPTHAAVGRATGNPP